MRQMTSILFAITASLLLAAPALASGGAAGTCSAHDGCFEFQIHGYYIINFLVFVGILVYFGRKPLAASLEKRYQEVAKEIEAAREAKLAAEQRLRDYQAKMAKLEDENQRMLAEMRAGTQFEMDGILAEARTLVARLTAEQAVRLEQESKRLRDQLHREAATKAMQMAEAIVRQRMDASTQAKLVEQTLNELEQLAGGVH